MAICVGSNSGRLMAHFFSRIALMKDAALTMNFESASILVWTGMFALPNDTGNSSDHIAFRFSYISSNIAPSHSSCPTSFSICNLPPEFRSVISHYSTVLLVFDFLGTTRQTYSARVSFRAPKSNHPTNYNVSYVQLFPICYVYGKMGSSCRLSPGTSK